MSSNVETTPNMQERFAEVFAHLPEQDIEQFYAHYQLWVLRHRIPILEKQIETLQAHREENQQLQQRLQPTAIALAVLVRLQSNGVNDVTLLDQMLERGEDWLDRMMQRLDYCEQVEDFIQGDYNQWCLNSLEGAYDWIDTLRGNQREEASRVLDAEETANSELTEELLLQKLSFDEDAIPVVTLVQPAIVTEPNASLIEETTLLDEQAVILTEQPVSSLIEETALLDRQPEAEELPAGSIESTMLALFLNQGTEAESEAEITPEQVSTVPWYSVNLVEDEPLELNQVDWMNVLQEDTPATLETGATDVVESGVAESIEPEEASRDIVEATVVASIETATLSTETEPDSTSVVEETVLEQSELLNIIFDEMLIPEQSENELADAELVVLQEANSDEALELNLSELEETTDAEESEPEETAGVEEIKLEETTDAGESESTTLEVILSAEREPPADEDTGEASLEIVPTEQASLLIEESDTLLDANEPDEEIVIEEQVETLPAEAIVSAEFSVQPALEEIELASTEVSSDGDETRLNEQEPGEEIVSDEPVIASIDAVSVDETALQEQADKALEATGMYYYHPAVEAEQPAWYEYLESDPELDHTLKQEWQITPEALPTALMWESQTGHVADEQTQPMMLREIKLASEMQNPIAEDQEPVQTGHMVPAEPQETLPVASAEHLLRVEEQTVLNTSQEQQAVLSSEEQQVLTSESKVDDGEQTLVAAYPVAELPSTYAQETVLTTVEEETIQESTTRGQSSEIVERIEEVHVVSVQPEQAWQGVAPVSTSPEPPKKPGFWQRLFHRK